MSVLICFTIIILFCLFICLISLYNFYKTKLKYYLFIFVFLIIIIIINVIDYIKYKI